MKTILHTRNKKKGNRRELQTKTFVEIFEILVKRYVFFQMKILGIALNLISTDKQMKILVT